VARQTRCEHCKALRLESPALELAALRAATGSGSCHAEQIVAERKLEAAVGTIRKRVGACLWKLRAKGIVAEVPQPGEYKGWRIS